MADNIIGGQNPSGKLPSKSTPAVDPPQRETILGKTVEQVTMSRRAIQIVKVDDKTEEGRKTQRLKRLGEKLQGLMQLAQFEENLDIRDMRFGQGMLLGRTQRREIYEAKPFEIERQTGTTNHICAHCHGKINDGIYTITKKATNESYHGTLSGIHMLAVHGSTEDAVFTTHFRNEEWLVSDSGPLKMKVNAKALSEILGLPLD